MKIRIQPAEVCIPEDNPFEHDLLGRKDSAEILTKVVGSIDGPCVLAIDAAWGAGKTTFINMWAQHLRGEGFPVVKFNAWETDFANDPFVALSTELTLALNQFVPPPPTNKIDTVRELAKKLSLRLVPSVIRAAGAAVSIVGPAVAEMGVNALNALTDDGPSDDRLSDYEKSKEAVSEFKTAIGDIAADLSKTSDGLPLVIIIDELDRCRPSYAIELLEVAKHLFMVDHIVFALAVNRSELAHSVKVLYGNDFDAAGYLRRFFDIDFRLPAPNRDQFITSLLTATEFGQHITQLQQMSYSARDSADLLKGFFNAEHFTLRQIAQAIHRLGLTFVLLPGNINVSPLQVILALIIMTSDTNIYYRFIQGEASDAEVVDFVFNLPGMSSLRETSLGKIFEAIIILSSLRQAIYTNVREMDSPLLLRYREFTNDSIESPSRAHDVLRYVEDLMSFGINNHGFNVAVQALGHLSTNLISR